MYDVNVIKYTMSWKRILVLTDWIAEMQMRLASMPNLVRESWFDSRVHEI